MKINKVKLGEEIRKARRKLQLTLQEVADELDLTRESIRSYELGRFLPDKNTLNRLFDFLEMDRGIIYLCTYEEDTALLLSKDEMQGKITRYLKKYEDNIAVRDLLYGAFQEFLEVVF